jgi:ferredoxin-NADP reductase
MFPVTFSSLDVRLLQTVQSIKRSDPWCLVTFTPGAGKRREKAVLLSGGSGMAPVFPSISTLRTLV